jgi:hypothetical protein
MTFFREVQKKCDDNYYNNSYTCYSDKFSRRVRHKLQMANSLSSPNLFSGLHKKKINGCGTAW